LVDEVRETLSFGIKVKSCDTEKSICMELHRNENILRVNQDYFVHDASSKDEHDRCLLILIIKLIHEIFHGLTTTFYILRGFKELIGDEESAGKRSNFFMATPINLGLSHGRGRNIIGDSGFAFEEHFTGGRLVSPSFGATISYKNPLIIMIIDPNSINNNKFYEVKDTLVQFALEWFQAPNHKTVTKLQLYNADTITVEYVPSTSAKKRSASFSSLAQQPPVKKACGRSSGMTIDIDRELLDEIEAAMLHGYVGGEEQQDDDEGEEVDENDPFVRVMYSQNFTTNSGEEVKVV